MNEEDVLLQVALANPEDDTARLVYADKVQERDEKLAAIIRIGVRCHCNDVAVRPIASPFCLDCNDKLWAPRCQHEGCRAQGRPCVIEDEPAENGTPQYETDYFCEEHAQEHGFCHCCGSFWGGIEAFDFDRAGLCPNCRDQIDADFDDGSDDEWDGDIDGIMEYGGGDA
jgi:uncharacterized protein (TIGR02996 family)